MRSQLCQAAFDVNWIPPLLQATTAPSLTLDDGTVAVRCGRNIVWQLSRGDRIEFYMKVCRDAADFLRQRWGLRQAVQLAHTHARYMAAELVYDDEDQQLIVTRRLNGIPVQQLLARGFRLDKNPWNRQEPAETARRALQAVLDWLDAFHQLRPDPGVPVYDHSSQSAWQRTSTKLRQLAALDPRQGAAWALWAQSHLSASSDPPSLVFGDTTLGNFLYAEGRVGAIDFEDIGLGTIARDEAVLRCDVAHGFSNLYYRRDRQITRLLDLPPNPARDLVELEIAAQHYERAMAQRGLSAGYRRYLLRRSLHRLFQRLVTARLLVPNGM